MINVLANPMSTSGTGCAKLTTYCDSYLLRTTYQLTWTIQAQEIS